MRGYHGGAGRDRTDDILLAKQALSQLSYGPKGFGEAEGNDDDPAWRPDAERVRKPDRASRPMARQPRRRMSPPALEAQERWWAWEDLNLRPHAYQARALTN